MKKGHMHGYGELIMLEEETFYKGQWVTGKK